MVGFSVSDTVAEVVDFSGSIGNGAVDSVVARSLGKTVADPLDFSGSVMVDSCQQ